MRLRYVSVTYQFGGASTSLERHYRELREAMLHPSQHYAYMQPSSAWRPPMDIHETPDAFLVKIEVAGMRDDNIEITLYDNALVVTGQREDDNDHDETVCYHEAQVRYGPFRADIALPMPVQQELCDAEYRDGFLRIRLPKAVAGMASTDDERMRSEPGRARLTDKLNAAPTSSSHLETLPIRGASPSPYALPRGE